MADASTSPVSVGRAAKQRVEGATALAKTKSTTSLQLDQDGWHGSVLCRKGESFSAVFTKK